MSFQVTVLKVLAGQPGGCLPVDELKRAVANFRVILYEPGDWERTLLDWPEPIPLD